MSSLKWVFSWSLKKSPSQYIYENTPVHPQSKIIFCLRSSQPFTPKYDNNLWLIEICTKEQLGCKFQLLNTKFIMRDHSYILDIFFPCYIDNYKRCSGWWSFTYQFWGVNEPYLCSYFYAYKEKPVGYLYNVAVHYGVIETSCKLPPCMLCFYSFSTLIQSMPMHWSIFSPLSLTYSIDSVIQFGYLFCDYLDSTPKTKHLSILECSETHNQF